MPTVFNMFGYKFYFWSHEFLQGSEKLELMPGAKEMFGAIY